MTRIEDPGEWLGSVADHLRAPVALGAESGQPMSISRRNLFPRTVLSGMDPEQTKQEISTIRAAEDGGQFETLVASLMEEIDGVRLADRNRLSRQGSEEIDLLFVNDRDETGLPGFDRDILVECKAQKAPVESKDVREFTHKLRTRHLDWGLLFALAGVTGDVERPRAGSSVIEESAIDGHRLLLVVEHELTGLRSGRHLAALLELKRVRMLSGKSLFTASAAELADLDPDAPGTGVGFLRGIEGIEQAMRQMRRDRLREMLRTLEGMEAESTTSVGDVRAALKAVEDAVNQHDADEDPLWLTVRPLLTDLGATILRLLGDELNTEHFERVAEINLAALDPGPVRVHLGSELWEILTSYYLGQAKEPSEQARDTAIYAFASLVIEEMISIDDIEPPYDDWPDPS